MTSSLRVDSSAEAEYEAAVRWYLERDVSVAEWSVGAVEAAFAEIAAHPERWPAIAGEPDPPPRRFVLPGLPFVIVYVVHDDGVLVLSIAHTSRRPGFWRNRGA